MTHTKPHVAVPQSDEVSARGTRVQHGATTNRRTGAVKLAARFLTAMAIVSLAIMYIATRDQLPDASAATGKINVLNVGTCYATDATAFAKGECLDGTNDAYDVAGRKDITKADPLYATYAVDPKTSAESPRAIVYNGDLIKISIKDDGRDKRTGVLYPVTVDGAGSIAGREDSVLTANDAYKARIKRSVGDDFDVTLASSTAYFDVTFSGTTLGTHVRRSGIKHVGLRGAGNGENPIAPIHDNDGHGMKLGRVKLFGFLQSAGGTDLVPTDDDDFIDLTSRIELDEDYGCIPDPTKTDPDKECRGDPPWFHAQFNVDEGEQITVMYVYYETSEQEEIVGGKKKVNYLGFDHPTDDDEDVAADLSAEAPAFVGDEDPVELQEPEGHLGISWCRWRERDTEPLVEGDWAFHWDVRRIPPAH